MDFRVKYPRTLHLPWSPGVHKDDRVIETLKMFEEREVIVTIKMDGENTSVYKDGTHARSLTTGYHPSRELIRKLQDDIGYEIPEGWRICGENLYAKHSILYPNLKSYFQVFSIWNEENNCLSWDDTLEWCELLSLTPVEVIYRGIYNEGLIKNLHKDYRDGVEAEGYVMRLADSFSFPEFPLAVAKYVRENHVQTNKHWSTEEMIKNGVVDEN